jgi:MinD-like ATPase involved in chromosome partitioning or flagellar assembly
VTVVALASAKGSPGVTTAALLLAGAWPVPRRAFLVEADPAGGDLAAWFQLGADPGLVSLVAAGRHDLAADIVRDHAQPLPGGNPVEAVFAPASVEQSTAALAASRGRLGPALDGLGCDVLVDCGRLDASSPVAELAATADLLVWVVRPSVGDVHHLAGRVPTLRRTGPTAVLVIGESPYTADDVAGAVGVAPLGSLPRDDRAAAALRGETAVRHLEKLPLLRSARGLAESLSRVSLTGVVA